jgi:hypothetical protein
MPKQSKTTVDIDWESLTDKERTAFARRMVQPIRCPGKSYLHVPKPDKCRGCEQVEVTKDGLWYCPTRWQTISDEAYSNGPPPKWCAKVGDRKENYK